MKKDSFFRYASFMIAYYTTNAIYQNFLPIWVRDIAGLDAAQRG